MIDMSVVNEEISRLEADDLTYKIAEKLAILYTIRKECKPNKDKVDGRNAQSEFMQVSMNAPIESLLMVLDEHMSAIQELYPKEYEYVIDRIKKVAI